MALNVVVLEGRIFMDLQLKNPDDEKRMFLSIPLSVKRNYKPEGDQYYPEDTLFCKAFGKKAQIISEHFKKDDNIILQGEMRVGDDYEKDGELVKGQPYMHVTDFQFLSARKNGNGDQESTAKKAPSSSSRPSAKSKLSSKRRNPLSA